MSEFSDKAVREELHRLGLISSFQSWLRKLAKSSITKANHLTIKSQVKTILNELIDQSSLDLAPGSPTRGSYTILRKLDTSFSEFAVVKGAAQFPLQRRETCTVLSRSPGPAAYSPNYDLLKRHSPRSVVPRSGLRLSVSRLSGPGPSTYAPRRSFLSRQL